jgi:acetate kinase
MIATAAEWERQRRGSGPPAGVGGSREVLALNCGSATLKFGLFAGPSSALPGQRLASGGVDGVGRQATLSFAAGEARLEEQASIADHAGATRRVLDWLSTEHFRIDAAGHRVVHGGADFTEPVLVDPSVVAKLEAEAGLAPLHNGPALAALRAASEFLGEKRPQVATFDTAFHQTLPDRASTYAIPRDLARRRGIRRYGFHGLAHRYMAERAAEVVGKPVADTRLITLQLGSGCSAAAVDGGRCVDTSMGLTPLEGLVMGTRSGDLDPAIPGVIARGEGVGPETVEDWLNHRSGLLGLSGRSADVRDLLAADDPDSALALDVYCYRLRKYIGAYIAALGGVDAIVFGGGVGEHQPSIRERACAGMDWAGIELDPARNEAAVGAEARISGDRSRLSVFVIPVDEESVIARDVAACLARAGVR